MREILTKEANPEERRIVADYDGGVMVAEQSEVDDPFAGKQWSTTDLIAIPNDEAIRLKNILNEKYPPQN